MRGCFTLPCECSSISRFLHSIPSPALFSNNTLTLCSHFDLLQNCRSSLHDVVGRAMESTTLSFPSPGPSLAVIARVSGQPLSTIIATDAGQDEVPSTVLSEGFTLYIPYSTQDRVVVTNTAAILSALATGTSKEILMYSNNNPIPTAETEVSLDAGSTLHVPYTAALPSMVTIANLADILTEAVRAQVSATNPASESVEQSNANASPSTINDDGSASSPSDSPGGVATSATSATAGRGEGSSTEGSSASNSADNASASISSTDGSSPIDSLQPNGVPNSTFGGALAGGILGGFIFGLLVGFVALWCIRRRRSRTTAVRNASRRKSVPKEKADFALTNASGWQKHLPQDRGDEAIVKALNNVFGQVQIYVDGFYEAKPGKPSSNAVTAVEQLSSDGFATVLRRADNALPVLEGVLMRWIIHRISLRSEAGESFLPPEYTLIPLINRWHMESDGSEKLAPEHLRKGENSVFSRTTPVL